MEKVADSILRALKRKEGEMHLFLEALVKAESPSKNPEMQIKSQNIICNELEKLDYRCFVLRGWKSGGQLYARPRVRNRSKAVQLLLGHSDTVWPKNTLDSMPYAQADRKTTGPGIYDMKAGLTQIVFAIKILQELKIEHDLEPLIFINTDEEVGSRESTKWIKLLANLSNRALVMEPPLGLDGKLKTSRKGIGRFTIQVEGKPAHAGLDPTGGASAILELSNQIQKLFALNDHEKGISVNVGLIEGGTLPNVIAARSQAVIDVRVPTNKLAESITEAILALKPSSDDFKLKITGGIGRPPMEKTARNERLWILAREKAKELGLKLEESSVGGGSDGNTTSQYTATLDGLGTTGDGAHAHHEFIFSDKLLERTALLAQIISAPSTN